MNTGTAFGKLRTGGDKFKVALGDGAPAEACLRLRTGRQLGVREFRDSGFWGLGFSALEDLGLRALRV